MAILHNLDLAVFATFHRRSKTFFLLLYDLHELFLCVFAAPFLLFCCLSRSASEY